MRKRLGIVLVAAAVLAGACSGDDGDGSGAPTPTVPGSNDAGVPLPAPTRRPRPRPAARPAGPRAGRPGGGDHAGPRRRPALPAVRPGWADGDDPLPVVARLPRAGRGRRRPRPMSQFGPLAEEEGFVAVFPHGTGEPVHWDVDLDEEGNADLAYFDAVLDRVGRRPLHRPVAGLRHRPVQRGHVVLGAGCAPWPTVIAAVAPVAGIERPDGCDPSRPVPLLTFHGTADPILLFNGGVDTVGHPWRRRAATTGPTTTRRRPTSTARATPATVPRLGRAQRLRPGADRRGGDRRARPPGLRLPRGGRRRVLHRARRGPLVALERVQRADRRIVGPTTFDVDASQEAWTFFQQFSLPAA